MTHAPRALVALVRGLLTALVTALLLQAPPAAASAPEYVALGDSYSSGTGTRHYLADGSDCLRSASAYPSLIAAAGGYALNFRACSGATVPDVAAAQLGALSPTTSLVTISVGGNDAGFADVLTECALPGWMSSCNRAIDGAQAVINGPLLGSLSTLYADIRGRAPSARVVVVGYPRIFNGEDCNAATWFSPTEEARLNQTADLLNARLASLAAATGFGFADPTSRFVGHAVCDDPEWINGLSWPIVESFHPNVAGHAQGYTPTVSPVLTGTTISATTAVQREARQQAWSLAVQQREYAALDSRIEPKRFVRPDLTTKAAQRAARAAGIDLDRWIDRHS